MSFPERGARQRDRRARRTPPHGFVHVASGHLGLFAAFQTSPTKDEALFQTMNDISTGAGATGVPLALGVQTFVLLRDTALCPLARWLRWQLVAPSASSYEVTFRIWVAANAPGGYARTTTAGTIDGQGADAGYGGPAYTYGPEAGAPPPNVKGGQLPAWAYVQGRAATGPRGQQGPAALPASHPSSVPSNVGHTPFKGKPTWLQKRATNPTHPEAVVPFIRAGTKVTK